MEQLLSGIQYIRSSAIPYVGSSSVFHGATELLRRRSLIILQRHKPAKSQDDAVTARRWNFRVSQQSHCLACSDMSQKRKVSSGLPTVQALEHE